MQNTDIESIRSQLEATKKQLAELEQALAKATETPKEWEPTRGEWTVWSDECMKMSTTNKLASLGIEFATEAAAQSAFDYIAWYRLLCNLAAQVNPSGKVGGEYTVYWNCRAWDVGGIKHASGTGYLFETEGAATRAAEILNRQKGTLAGRKCPFLQ